MLAKVLSFGVLGIEAYLMEIEVDVTRGLPAITLVGLADTAVKESKDRVKSALKNSGFSWPGERITISLLPSGIKKEGASFDLAIALGVLSASGQINSQNLKEYYVLGELSLDGSLRPVRGVLPISIAAARSEIKNILLPYANVAESAIVTDLRVFAVKNLRETVEFLNNPQDVARTFTSDLARYQLAQTEYPIDFSEVKGHHLAKRALEVTVSGNHNLLMIGPPGSGKSMLAKRIPTIMPDLTRGEMLEVSKIHSVVGSSSLKDGLLNTRPFRSPHHTVSAVALAGGGSLPQPGEISLAHLGVLFLDELPEFRRDCLETLRQPLEDGSIRVSRMLRSLTFPAAFMLVCAMNPCPCGMLGQPRNPCRCSTTQIARYRAKISGPLLDRIDIHIEVPAVRYQELSSNLPAESSAQIKERVNNARAIQTERFKREGIFSNAQMSHRQVRKLCLLGKEENDILRIAMTELNLSARAYDKVLKVSRTIADLAGSESIKTEHLAEAIQYRSLDRDFYVR